MISFQELYCRQKQEFPVGEVLLAIDPGETTGYTVMKMTEETEHINSVPRLLDFGQLDTKSPLHAAKEITLLFYRFSPHYVVVEDYRMYANKAKEHTGNDMMTSRIIGMIEMECARLGLKQPHKQMASVAKQFCTDEKLKAWNFWYKGLKHARDSARHAIYYLLFSHKKHKEKLP